MTKPYRSDAHQTLAERELAIVEAHAPMGLDAQFRAIATDRAARWAQLLADREESGEARTWAATMAAQHRGQLVRVHRTTVPWIMALYVVRYGEAEDFWPAQLGADDMVKAHLWLGGPKPEAITYLEG